MLLSESVLDFTVMSFVSNILCVCVCVCVCMCVCVCVSFRKARGLENLQKNNQMKNAVFWDVALCRSCVNRRFRGMYCLQLSQQSPAHACFSLGDFFTLKMKAIHSSETSVHTRST
jgi:hypothetical protein